MKTTHQSPDGEMRLFPTPHLDPYTEEPTRGVHLLYEVL